MKRYKFEIEFTEEDLSFDEFMEEVSEAGSGGAELLKNEIASLIDEYGLFVVEAKNLITVKSYSND